MQLLNFATNKIRHSMVIKIIFDMYLTCTPLFHFFIKLVIGRQNQEVLTFGQFSSSDISPQLSIPLHTLDLAMHLLLAHLNSCFPQAPPQPVGSSVLSLQSANPSQNKLCWMHSPLLQVNLSLGHSEKKTQIK